MAKMCILIIRYYVLPYSITSKPQITNLLTLKIFYKLKFQKKKTPYNKY